VLVLSYFIIIDSLNLLYRSFYSLKDMRNSKNVHVGAFFGYIKTFLKLIKKFNPDSIIITTDSLCKKRIDIFPKYKEHRQSTPLELESQKKFINDFFKLIHLPIFKIDGFEADDIICEIAADISKNKNRATIISSDKDLHHLALLENINIFDPIKDIYIDKKWIYEKYDTDVTKEQILLYYSLCGDSSDGFPGIKGIGEKLAKNIIKKYKSIDLLYDNFENDNELTKRQKDLLNNGKQSAYESYNLVSSIPIDILNFKNYEKKCKFNKKKLFNANPLFDKLECNSLIIDPETYKKTKINDIENEKIPYAQNNINIRIYSHELIEEIKTKIKNSKIIAIDTETRGGDPKNSTIVGFSMCFSKEESWYIPLIINGIKTIDYTEKLNLLLSLESDKICIMHNAIFDLHVFKNAGISINANIYDTMITAHIFKENKIGLKDLSLNILKERMHSFEETIEKGRYRYFDDVPMEKAAPYAATDARQTYMLYNHYQERLKLNENKKIKLILDEIEMPLIKVLFQMELNGINCDKNILNEQEKIIQNNLKSLEKEILKAIPEKFKYLNPLSNNQVGILLYDELNLETNQKTKKQKFKSTSQKTLYEIDDKHPVVPMIIKYRALHSISSHFTKGLIEYINKDNRIYTHYQQTIVSTGRLSTVNPNLQNVPIDQDEISIRKAFSAKENNLIGSFDYSQIELRVLAHISDDKNLINAFLNNEDIHLKSASHIFKKNIKEINNKERQIAKKINFSIIYGLSAFGLSKDLKISTTAAKNYIEEYKKLYPDVFNWIDKTCKMASENGYVETYFGLKRYINELKDKNNTIRAYGNRIAINTIIQGTAAEIMKKSMIKVHEYLNKNKNGKIVLQIHDEILIEFDEKNKKTIEKEIKNIMENIVDFKIPLLVNTNTGKYWK
jgi:DNA polymerase-1